MTANPNPNFLMESIKGSKRKVIICKFFNQFPHSRYTVKELCRLVFKDELQSREIRPLLFDLTDRPPYFLKSRKAYRLISGCNRQVELFWKNHNADISKQDTETSLDSN